MIDLEADLTFVFSARESYREQRLPGTILRHCQENEQIWKRAEWGKLFAHCYMMELKAEITPNDSTKPQTDPSPQGLIKESSEVTRF